MNKIPKCTKKMIPIIKANRKNNKETNFTKIKVLTVKSISNSFGKDITNIVKNKENITKKKSSSVNEKVNNVL